MPATKTRVTYRRRERKIESLKQHLLRKSYPRLHASLILLLTGLAGFLVSFALLRFGVSSMWLRYPVAIVFAYGVFLLLLRVWLWVNRPDEFDLALVEDALEVSFDATESVDPGFGGGADFAGGGAGGSWEESVSTVTTSRSLSSVSPAKGSGSSGFNFDLDLEDAWLIVIAIIALLAAAIAALYVVDIAPALLAEILLDGVLMAGLYKRVKTIDHRHWLRAALRKTALPAVLVAVFFSVAGFAIQKAAPEARSIGEVWHHITG